MKLHKPITLTEAERMDLGSITKHPGLDVLLKIAKGHSQQQLLAILEINPDDPERVTKLDAISSSAYAMDLFLQLLEREIDTNWKYLQQQEEKQRNDANPRRT